MKFREAFGIFPALVKRKEGYELFHRHTTEKQLAFIEKTLELNNYVDFFPFHGGANAFTFLALDKEKNQKIIRIGGDAQNVQRSEYNDMIEAEMSWSLDEHCHLEILEKLSLDVTAAEAWKIIKDAEENGVLVVDYHPANFGRNSKGEAKMLDPGMCRRAKEEIIPLEKEWFQRDWSRSADMMIEKYSSHRDMHYVQPKEDGPVEERTGQGGWASKIAQEKDHSWVKAF